MATAKVSESFDRFRTLVAEALTETLTPGEVPDAVSPEAQSQLLLALTQGTSPLSRAGADTTRAIAAIDLAVNSLRPAAELRCRALTITDLSSGSAARRQRW